MEYSAFKRSDLVKLCREKHITHYSHKNKQELIQLLLKVVKPVPTPPTIASTILRHYCMYPLLTAALFASREAH